MQFRNVSKSKDYKHWVYSALASVRNDISK